MLKVLFAIKRLQKSAIEELPIFVMILQAWTMILLVMSIGGVVNPPPPMAMHYKSTDGRVCCDLLCSGELQNYKPLPFDCRPRASCV